MVVLRRNFTWKQLFSPTNLGMLLLGQPVYGGSAVFRGTYLHTCASNYTRFSLSSHIFCTLIVATIIYIKFYIIHINYIYIYIIHKTIYNMQYMQATSNSPTVTTSAPLTSRFRSTAPTSATAMSSVTGLQSGVTRTAVQTTMKCAGISLQHHRQ